MPERSDRPSIPVMKEAKSFMPNIHASLSHIPKAGLRAVRVLSVVLAPLVVLACKPKIDTSAPGLQPKKQPIAQGPLAPAPVVEAAKPEKQTVNDGLAAPVCELQYPLKKGTWITVEGGKFRASRSYAGGHSGVDFAPTNSGEKIFATANGKVFLDPATGEAYGNRFSIEHPPCSSEYSFISFFAHNSRNIAAVGSIVQKGELVAYTGNTGSASRGEHLHYDLANNLKSPTTKTGSGDSDGYFVNPQKFMNGHPQ
jgi:murein DD-endopeptidase MepM/ murein hydrolase activator NlpD